LMLYNVLHASLWLSAACRLPASLYVIKIGQSPE